MALLRTLLQNTFKFVKMSLKRHWEYKNCWCFKIIYIFKLTKKNSCLQVFLIHHTIKFVNNFYLRNQK